METQHAPLTAHFEHLVKENKQLKINERWLIAQMNTMHDLLCPGQIETWQGRIRQVIEKIESLVEKTNMLDITKIRTVEDINSTDFSKYADTKHLVWVRCINTPVSSGDLSRICALSRQPGSKIKLNWSMGELFYYPKETEDG